MIHWHVEIEGVVPTSIGGLRNRLWFPDFEVQEHLLPWFNVGDVPIDEYGSTRFDAAAVRRLRVHLEWYSDMLDAKIDKWRIEIIANGIRNGYDFDRAVLSDLIAKAIDLAKYAEAAQGHIVFLGD